MKKEEFNTVQVPKNISDNTKIYTFTFAADTDWVPGEAGCWTDCPFAYLLKLGDVCKYIKNKVKCPLSP